jgi:hypothetical protein
MQASHRVAPTSWLAVICQVGRAVPGLGQLPRGTLEAPLRELATTLDFGQPVASLQVCGPQVSLCAERIAGA